MNNRDIMNRHRIRLCLSLCILSLLYECNNAEVSYQAPEFQKIEVKEFDMLSGDLGLYKVIYDFYLYQDFYVIISLNEDNFVNVYSKDSYRLVASSVKRGNGPIEMVGCTWSYLDEKTHNLILYESSSDKTVSVNLDSLINGSSSSITRVELESSSNRLQSFFPVGENMLVINRPLTVNQDDDGLSRFMVIGKKGEIISQAEYWPEISVGLKAPLYILNHPTAITADGDKLAIGTENGAILETFKVRNNDVLPMSVNYFYKCDFDEIGRDMSSSKTILGMIDLYATNDRVYAAADFENLYGDQFGYKEYLFYNKIAVIDWKGRPLKLVITDRTISKIFVEGDYVYALVKVEDGGRQIARIKI